MRVDINTPLGLIKKALKQGQYSQDSLGRVLDIITAYSRRPGHVPAGPHSTGYVLDRYLTVPLDQTKDALF